MPSQPLLKPTPRARSPTLLGITINSTLGTKTYAKRSAALHQRRWSSGAAVTRPSGLLLARRSGSDPTY